MAFSRIFGVFSRRTQPSDNADSPLTVEFKNRVIMLCEDTFDPELFWLDIYNKLQYLVGRQSLTRTRLDNLDDLSAYLAQCGDEQFLDFVGLIFQSRFIWSYRVDVNEFIGNINSFFEADALPYYLTKIVFRRYEKPISNTVVPFPHPEHSIPELEARPRVVRRDSEVVHQHAIAPALEVLANSAYSSAHEEFLDALKDYRRANHRDCMTKCGSSLESVMRVICAQRGWPYQQNDNAQTLLNNIFPQTGLESFFKQPITLVATIRNQLGSAHGAGAEPREVPDHAAQYAINATASAILLLIKATDL